MEGQSKLNCYGTGLRRAAFALTLASTWLVMPSGAHQAPIDQRAFHVQHVELQAAAAKARALLGDDTRSVVFADQSSGRLLVQAPPTKLGEIQELLENIDRPPVAATNDDAGESFLRAYQITPGRRAAAARWAGAFQAPTGTRVAFDERTSQLLVMGPDNVHRFVVRQIENLGQGAPSPVVAQGSAASELRTSSQPAQASPPDQVGPALRLTLERSSGNQLHRQLEQLLSRPLAATASPAGDRISFRAEMAPGTGVLIDAATATGDVFVTGSPQQVKAWTHVLRAIDAPSSTNSMTQVVATQPNTDAQIRQALRVVQASSGRDAGIRTNGQLANMLFQPQDNTAADNTNEEQAVAAVPFAAGSNSDEGDPGETALLGPVQVQFVEGLDIILIRGNKRDVERVMAIINRIEQVSAETVPAIEVLPLKHVESQAMARLLERVYTQVLGARSGSLSITPLGKPNSLLLVGRPENVRTAIDLVKRIDVPVEPTTRFEVFPLEYAVAGDVKQIIDAFLAEQEGEDDEDVSSGALRPKAMVVSDFRTNSLFVNAGPRDLAEIAALVREIDVNRGAAVDEVRIFPLKNTLASELADVLRTAVLAREEGQTQEGGTALSARVSALRFVTIDPENQRRLESGVLSNIRVAADTQANSLVVTAPSDSMDLIAALIEQLDQVPDAEAEIKVFTIVNGDAVSLAAMLGELFGTGEDDDDGPALRAGENSLVRLQFSVDERTNSIIAAGSQADLAVVYAILLQLDASETRQRRTEVYRLKNSPAEEVAIALNEWLRTEREAEVAAELAISPFEQIEREVVIVPELVSNSLIVSATPRYFEEIANLVDELDERPPMVVIQVLIAEVRLNDTDEFGVELGLQDSILFDRSVIDLDGFQTIETTTIEQSAGGANVQTVQQNIVNAPIVPGFNFNNQTLGSNASDSSLATAGTVAAQGLSNFALNRINPELGFGGFVFSASSSSVSALLRALQENRRLEVLSRPQITALDNQLAIVQVGQRVPRVANTQISTFGQTNTVVYEDVGIILQVQPRVSPDGMVVMNVEATKSKVGSEAEGIPIFTGVDGSVVRAPRIDQIFARSTVAAASGQTIVLSGLLAKESFDVHRRVPIIADIPLLGDLFRYDAVTEQRSELLIVMTPRVIRNEQDAEMVKQVESSRMSWVLCDVVNLHGPSGLRSRCDEWTAADSESVYPTHVPVEGEFVPTPAAVEGPYLQDTSEPHDEGVVAPQPEASNQGTPAWQPEAQPVSYQSTNVPPSRLPAPLNN